MKKIIIFLGPPGSGKGTQAKLIAAKYKYGHISTGDLLRTLATKAGLSAEEQAAVETMKQGKLVSDQLIYSLVFKEIERYTDNGQGVVLDGAIRNVNQAKEYQKFFERKKIESEVITIEIALPDVESFNRLANRRVCSACGEIVPARLATRSVAGRPIVPSAPATTCPKCSSPLVARADDALAVVDKRVREQGNVPLKPIKDFYEALGVLKSVDGRQTIQKVDKDVQMILRG